MKTELDALKHSIKCHLALVGPTPQLCGKLVKSVDIIDDLVAGKQPVEETKLIAYRIAYDLAEVVHERIVLWLKNADRPQSVLAPVVTTNSELKDLLNTLDAAIAGSFLVRRNLLVKCIARTLKIFGPIAGINYPEVDKL